MATLGQFDELFPVLEKQSRSVYAIWGPLILVASTCGVLGSTTVIVATLRHRCSNEMLLLLSLLWADFTACIIIFIGNGYHLATGTFFFGKIGCAIEAIVIIFGAVWSMMSLSAIALERYLIVVKGKLFTRTQVIQIICGILVYAAVITGFPYYTNHYMYLVGMFPSMCTCAVASWDKHTMNFVQMALIFVTVAGCCTVLAFCYYSIYLCYRKTMPKFSMVSTIGDFKSAESQTSSQAKAKQKKDTLERKLFYKCLIITSTFVTCWSPYAVRVIYELCTDVIVDGHLDAFLIFITLSSSMANPFIVFTFDGTVNKNVKEMFGLMVPQSSFKSHSAAERSG
ncbi:hypothetical protein EDD86DRAFT_150353 [Gorgonomyces haynaldii]|nr:hypothetical protein EDD86DRAFT_150353 [Gorgonomyces haynaldii]